MKIAVIVTDAGQSANAEGGKCETIAHIFDMPDCIEKFIIKSRGGYGVVALSIAEDHSEPREPR
jgi:hypothetical protein